MVRREVNSFNFRRYVHMWTIKRWMRKINWISPLHIWSLKMNQPHKVQTILNFSFWIINLWSFIIFTEKMNIMWSPTNVNLMMVIRKIRVLHDFFMLVIISNVIKSKYILCGNNYSSNQFIDNILFSWLDLELFFWKYNISRGVSGLQLVTPTGTKLKGQQWMLSSLMEYEPL